MKRLLTSLHCAVIISLIVSSLILAAPTLTSSSSRFARSPPTTGETTNQSHLEMKRFEIPSDLNKWKQKSKVSAGRARGATRVQAQAEKDVENALSSYHRVYKTRPSQVMAAEQRVKDARSVARTAHADAQQLARKADKHVHRVKGAQGNVESARFMEEYYRDQLAAKRLTDQEDGDSKHKADVWIKQVRELVGPQQHVEIPPSKYKTPKTRMYSDSSEQVYSNKLQKYRRKGRNSTLKAEALANKDARRMQIVADHLKHKAVSHLRRANLDKAYGAFKKHEKWQKKAQINSFPTPTRTGTPHPSESSFDWTTDVERAHFQLQSKVASLQTAIANHDINTRILDEHFKQYEKSIQPTRDTLSKINAEIHRINEMKSHTDAEKADLRQLKALRIYHNNDLVIAREENKRLLEAVKQARVNNDSVEPYVIALKKAKDKQKVVQRRDEKGARSIAEHYMNKARVRMRGPGESRAEKAFKALAKHHSWTQVSEEMAWKKAGKRKDSSIRAAIRQEEDEDIKAGLHPLRYHDKAALRSHKILNNKRKVEALKSDKPDKSAELRDRYMKEVRDHFNIGNPNAAFQSHAKMRFWNEAVYHRTSRPPKEEIPAHMYDNRPNIADFW